MAVQWAVHLVASTVCLLADLKAAQWAQTAEQPLAWMLAAWDCSWADSSAVYSVDYLAALMAVYSAD